MRSDFSLNNNYTITGRRFPSKTTTQTETSPPYTTAFTTATVLVTAFTAILVELVNTGGHGAPLGARIETEDPRRVR